MKASPVARRMARDLGVELAQLEGTGPGGRIVKADVQAAAENGGGGAEGGAAEEGGGGRGGGAAGEGRGRKKAAAKDEKKDKKPAKKEAQRGEAGVKGDVDVEELTRLQQTVSRRMAESKATAPDFSIALTVDMTAAVELRDAAQGDLGAGPVVQRHGREGLRQRAARAPARERRLPRRQVRALRPRERRHRRRGDGRARRADRLRRRQEVTRPDRPRRPRGDRQGQGEDRHPAGALGRHVHGLEPRHVRHRAASPRSSIRPRRRSSRSASSTSSRRWTTRARSWPATRWC